MIAFLWAQSKNGVIGKDGKLPWHLPADMHYFKVTTTGHTILTGRTTYLSFGRPLPNRLNCVLTHHSASELPSSVKVFNNVDEFLSFYKKSNKDVFVVGGASVYRQLLSVVDYLYVTLIDATVPGDTKMPHINYDQFNLISERYFNADQKNQYNYRFKIYKRK